MDEHTFATGSGDLGSGRSWWTDDVNPSAPPQVDFSADRLVDELTATARAKAAAVSMAVAELVDAVAALAPHMGPVSATLRQWVAWQCGLTSTEAARVCTLAEKLPDLPHLDAAFRAGELSDGVTQVLAKVATPENEATILDFTRDATGAQLEVLVRDFRRMRRTPAEPAADDEESQAAPSEASWGWSDDGRFEGRWDLAPDDGATMEAALEQAMAALVPSEDDVDANAVAEGESRPEERPRVRLVDALLALAESALAAGAVDDLVPEAHQIILRRDLDPNGVDLGAMGSVLPTALDGAGAIVRHMAEALECDALVITQDMIAGFPVSEPTASRSFNRSQRRALRARDRTCRYPGCGRTKHLHAHHTEHWQVTRRTSVAAGVLLCRQHHTLVHARRHRIALGVDGAVTVTRADGSTLRGATPRPPAVEEILADGVPEPGPDVRRTGTGERLTHYARDVIIEHWDRYTPRPPPGPGPDPGGHAHAPPAPAAA